jgi:hypothetical protein
MDPWVHRRGVTLDLSSLGKSTDDAFVAAFNAPMGLRVETTTIGGHTAWSMITRQRRS